VKLALNKHPFEKMKGSARKCVLLTDVCLENPDFEIQIKFNLERYSLFPKNVSTF